MQLEKVRQTELMANYEQELRLKDLQISLQQDSLEAIEAEVEWARVHVAQREDQIALLREGFSDEVNLCLDTIIDPAFAP